MCGAAAASRTRAGLHDDVQRILADLRLLERADAAAGVLSHGEQQWLEIAMAVAGRPRLLLLDEPTGGMSPEERRARRIARWPRPRRKRRGTGASDHEEDPSPDEVRVGRLQQLAQERQPLRRPPL